MTSLRDELIQLSKAVATKAQEKDTNIQDSTDALKALTTAYAVLEKNPGKDGDNENNGGTFADFASTMKELPDGSAELAPRNSRRSPARKN